MNLSQLVYWLKHHDYFAKNIVHWEQLPAREAQFGEMPDDLENSLRAVLENQGIKKLYIHQSEAYRKITEGKNVALLTPTASGKTLAYNLPVLNNILQNPSTRALYLFPTKALAQDQLKGIYRIIEAMEAPIKTYTFDGDTPVQARKAIRQAGQIVISNPDMLHQGILPHHTIWLKLFESLRYVVIDEIHYYRGVFGSHFANVIRRLKRVAEFYGSKPQFICCSATMGNAKEFIETIVGEEVELIERNGAPSGEKHVIFYNPPVVNAQLGIRKGVIGETRKLGALFLEADLQTIIFARSRIKVEVLSTYLKKIAGDKWGKPELVRGYRGGYLPSERRAIENGLKNNTVKTVVSTNALELGIDIGTLDVAIMAGYPGGVASTWQQAGRAGRRNSSSVAIVVATASPLDQFLMKNPDYFFSLTPEENNIDPNNLAILMSHLKCAAFEIPFKEDENFGVDVTRDILEYLAENKILKKSGDKYFWMQDTYPAETVGLRSASPDNVVIIDTTNGDKVIGEADLFSAPMLVHTDAIYIHEGEQYYVDKLDWERKKAYVHKVKVDHFTDAVTKTDIQILEEDRSEKHEGFTLNFGEINVSNVVTGYKKIKMYSHENIGYGKVLMPEVEMATTAFWIEFLPEFIEQTGIEQQENFSSALNGIGFNLRNILPIYVRCDVSDIRTVPMVRAPHSGLPTLYVYDNFPGGTGLSDKLVKNYREILHASYLSIKGCECEGGCPSCVGPGPESDNSIKENSLKILELLLQEADGS